MISGNETTFALNIRHMALFRNKSNNVLELLLHRPENCGLVFEKHFETTKYTKHTKINQTITHITQSNLARGAAEEQFLCHAGSVC
jgi:hypothetical protein